MHDAEPDERRSLYQNPVPSDCAISVDSSLNEGCIWVALTSTEARALALILAISMLVLSESSINLS